MRSDPNLRSKLGRDDTLEVSLLEPQNENYAWQVGDLTSCQNSIYEDKSEWSLLFSKNKNQILYNRLEDNFLIPGSSVYMPKSFISDNIGIRKITLRTYPGQSYSESILSNYLGQKTFQGNCEITLAYQRTEQGVYYKKMDIHIP